MYGRYSNLVTASSLGTAGMKYTISLFAPKSSPIGATGCWEVDVDSPEQAVKMARFYADPVLWPSGSTWLVVAQEDADENNQAGVWKW